MHLFFCFFGGFTISPFLEFTQWSHGAHFLCANTVSSQLGSSINQTLKEVCKVCTMGKKKLQKGREQASPSTSISTKKRVHDKGPIIEGAVKKTLKKEEAEELAGKRAVAWLQGSLRVRDNAILRKAAEAGAGGLDVVVVWRHGERMPTPAASFMASVRTCVCVCERESEKNCVCVCMCMCMGVCVYGCVYVCGCTCVCMQSNIDSSQKVYARSELKEISTLLKKQVKRIFYT